jgi:hypothetical protein
VRGAEVKKPLFLTFADDVAEIVRHRVRYSLRVFAAIFDYGVATEETSETTRCFYGDAIAMPRGYFHILARYSAASRRSQELTAWQHGGEDFYLFSELILLTGARLVASDVYVKQVLDRLRGKSN